MVAGCRINESLCLKPEFANEYIQVGQMRNLVLMEIEIPCLNS
jgi:hypothetical protein